MTRQFGGLLLCFGYAVRAPVATPLRWEELEDPRLRADSFTLASVPERLERGGDPWAAIGHG